MFLHASAMQKEADFRIFTLWNAHLVKDGRASANLSWRKLIQPGRTRTKHEKNTQLLVPTSLSLAIHPTSVSVCAALSCFMPSQAYPIVLSSLPTIHVVSPSLILFSPTFLVDTNVLNFSLLVSQAGCITVSIQRLVQFRLHKRPIYGM